MPTENTTSLPVPKLPTVNPNNAPYVVSDALLLRRLGRQLADGYGLRRPVP